MSSKKYVLSIFQLVLMLGLAISGQVSPHSWPGLSLLAMGLPLILMLFILGFLYSWLKRGKLTYLSLSFLLFFPYLRAILPSPAAFFSLDSEDQGFQALSYNVRVFNLYPHLHQGDISKTQDLINWAAQHPAEIKCFPEFYNQSGHPTLNSVEIIQDQGYKTQVSYPTSLHRKEGYFGTVLFSKLPVIHSGDFPLQEKWHQRGVFMDVIFQKDTLRVVGVHLQSIALNVPRLTQIESQVESNLNKAINLLKILEAANQKRAEQIIFLEDFLAQSPYPVLLMGDFNDLPWTYTYQKLRTYLENAHEHQGKDFGFSYRGGIPFLRIDHQFFSNELSCLDFQTLYSIQYSDHYPILARYSWGKNTSD